MHGAAKGEAQQRELRLAERKAELELLADRSAVKKKRSKEGRFRPVLPDTPPPSPIGDDFWPPPPVEPSDESFIRPEVSDTKRPLRDDFSRPLTNIIDSKENKIEVIPKTETFQKQTLTKQTYQNNSVNFFLNVMNL